MYCRLASATIQERRMTMKRLFSFTALLAAMALLAACATPAPVPTLAPPQAGTATFSPAQTGADGLGQFKTVDLQGNGFDYSMFHKNKLTMVNVWATWCGYCVQEMPELAKLSGEYANKGFVIVGILGDSVTSFDKPVRDDAAVADGLSIMQKSGVTYTVLQPDDVLCKKLSTIEGYPTTYFVDSTGAVVDTVVGAQSYDGWKARIDSLLAKVK